MPMRMEEPRPGRPKVPRLPAILCRSAGTLGIDAAWRQLGRGGDTLDAALAIATAQEDDPNDTSAGLGGLPTQDGSVELEACCLHGPTRKGAAVAGLGGIRNAARLAQAVMLHADAPLLVGARAQDFAMAQGFAPATLLTERARHTWALWQHLRAAAGLPATGGPLWPTDAGTPDYLPATQRTLDALVNRLARVAQDGGLAPQWTWRAALDALLPAAAPFYASAVDAQGRISCAATSSGLPWRMPGGASDIAMIGAGLCLDPAVGAVGASGSAAANLRIGGAQSIVQAMRRGLSPEDAGLDALHRLADSYGPDRDALRLIEIVYYIQRVDGAYACVSLWRGDRTGHVRTYTIHDGVRRSETCAFLFDGSPLMRAG